MQYIDYRACTDAAAVAEEIYRLARQRYISQEQAQMVDSHMIAAFFSTSLGQKLRTGNVIREFKFSILEDGAAYDPALKGEQVLLQGVVDCALLEEDGITVIDFKTDYVTEERIPEVAARYQTQVQTYAEALQRIYEQSVKAKYLYLFHLDRFVPM